MQRVRLFLLVAVLSAACGTSGVAPGAGKDAGASGDAGSQTTHDSGTAAGDDAGTETDAGDFRDAGADTDAGQTSDAGPPVECTRDTDCSGGKACCAGACIDTQTDLNHCGACGAPICATECAAGTCAAAHLSLDLFELAGKVTSGGTMVSIKLLAPYVSVLKGSPPAHAYDDRQGVLGCYADHFAVGETPPADANAGTIKISGYSGGTIQTSAFASHTALSEMNCAVVKGNYQCGYGALQGNGQPQVSAATQPYPNGSPLGSGTITFSDAANMQIGTFSTTGKAAGTLTINGGDNLNSLSIRTAQATTIHYSCSGGTSASPLILVTLAATRNTAANASDPSASFGSVTCGAVGGTSLTIPAGAITAMLDGDTLLKSVFISAVCAEPSPTPAHDSAGNPISVVVGRGAFGISAL